MRCLTMTILTLIMLSACMDNEPDKRFINMENVPTSDELAQKKYILLSYRFSPILDSYMMEVYHRNFRSFQVSNASDVGIISFADSWLELSYGLSENGEGLVELYDSENDFTYQAHYPLQDIEDFMQRHWQEFEEESISDEISFIEYLEVIFAKNCYGLYAFYLREGYREALLEERSDFVTMISDIEKAWGLTLSLDLPQDFIVNYEYDPRTNRLDYSFKYSHLDFGCAQVTLYNSPISEDSEVISGIIRY